jgi:hypothetical protein
MEPSHTLRWIECHPSLAGYIQAVGIVGTLVLAVLGPPLIYLFNNLYGWWYRRLDAIVTAHNARVAVCNLLQQIDARLEKAPSVTPAEPWRGGIYAEMSVQVPFNLAPPPTHSFDSRLRFLQEIGQRAIAYNEWLIKLPTATVPHELDIQRGQIETALSDLRCGAVQVRQAIDNMKIVPWSRNNVVTD